MKKHLSASVTQDLALGPGAVQPQPQTSALKQIPSRPQEMLQPCYCPMFPHHVP